MNLNRSIDFKQRGMATLLVTLVLTMIMGVMALTTAQSGLMEQKITGNDLRAREAQEAAEAGLEYGVAWAKKHAIANSVKCDQSSMPTGCPSALTTVVGSSTGETYSYTLNYTKGTDAIKVTSTALGVADNTIMAKSEAWVKQIPIGLFDQGATMPPPWVIAGCITTAPTGNPSTFVLDSNNKAVITGSTAVNCLPQGNLDVKTWQDADNDYIKDVNEDDAAKAATFNTGTFSGCPNTNCAWNHAFKMSLQEAKQLATEANHVFNSTIPCGPASSSPSIYLINNAGPLNPADVTGSCTSPIDGDTIGAPNKPILLIIPSSAGCPKFNGGITIYGIVYMETPTACAANGWGGATVYGSVIWEGNVDKPNANTEFIEVNWKKSGDLNDVFNLGIDDTTRIPGTWKDF